jgi:hypothetical protein
MVTSGMRETQNPKTTSPSSGSIRFPSSFLDSRLALRLGRSRLFDNTFGTYSTPPLHPISFFSAISTPALAVVNQRSFFSLFLFPVRPSCHPLFS